MRKEARAVARSHPPAPFAHGSFRVPHSAFRDAASLIAHCCCKLLTAGLKNSILIVTGTRPIPFVAPLTPGLGGALTQSGLYGEREHMKKSALLRNVAADTGIPYSTVKRVVDSMLDHVIERLQDGDRVVLSGFGTFALRPYKARTWRPTSARVAF